MLFIQTCLLSFSWLTTSSCSLAQKSASSLAKRTSCGNFGNALGGYYAKKMGIPIKKILIASNENNILTQWINDGVYDINNKELILTNSPAMDILKSSNIERILFDMFGATRTKALLDDLNNNLRFELSTAEKEKLQEEFWAIESDDAFGLETIKSFLDDGYLMDPHTATCLKAYENFPTKTLKSVMYSTAEWTKFSPTVLNALNQDDKKYHDKEALEEISEKYNANIPKIVHDIFETNILHKDVVQKENIEREIIEFIKQS